MTMRVSRTELTRAPPKGIKEVFLELSARIWCEEGIRGMSNAYGWFEKEKPLNLNPESCAE